MTPEAVSYLEKARQCLTYARINLSVNLGNDAGRNAYLAAFHSAQAYNLKAVADYEMGPDSVVPNDHAAAAIASAEHFVECIASLLR